jgi:hypothetical protein
MNDPFRRKHLAAAAGRTATAPRMAITSTGRKAFAEIGPLGSAVLSNVMKASVRLIRLHRQRIARASGFGACAICVADEEDVEP